MATKKKKAPKTTHKVARDSGSGEFIPMETAKRRPRTTTVETVPNRKPKKAKKR